MIKMAYELGEQKKIGLGLIGFGIMFSFLAMILFFDRGLLAPGNILWLAGVTFLLGLRSTLQLFTNKTNYKGSLSFLLGIFLIFVRWPIIGIIIELYGVHSPIPWILAIHKGISLSDSSIRMASAVSFTASWTTEK